MNCRHCSKECKNENSLRNHERLCKKNPDRQQSSWSTYNKRSGPWNKGLTKEDPRVAKNAEGISKSLKGKPSKMVWTDERRKAKSEWKKQLHREHPELHPNRILASNRKSWTYPEKVAGEWLDKNNIQYERNKKIDIFYPDFVIGSMIIEIDGKRWHDKQRDDLRDKRLNELGYIVYRIDAKENIEKRLQEILSDC